MATTYVQAASRTVLATTGRDRDRSWGSIAFLVALWFSLFFGVMVLVALIASTAIEGSSRFDNDLVTRYSSTLSPEHTGFRAGILGSIWVMLTTALLSVPLGIAAALHLEEFADRERWYNRFIEVNLQNLAAVPSVVYGLLAVAFVGVIGIQQRGLVISGAVALSLLILPVIIITTREALRSVPREIRDGSLALGATMWQTTWRQVLPAAVPGIATGSILAMSRAIGEAAPLILVGATTFVTFNPDGVLSKYTTLPVQIYNLVPQDRDAFRDLAYAAILLLIVVLLAMNAVAIWLRNRYQRRW
jgi:phosphate transport system permease protein